MSDLNQIHTALERLFHDEGKRIVFWHDPDREFLNTLPFVSLEGVTNLRLDKVGALDAKIRIERHEADTKFLLYTPSEEPDPQDDWLLDIRLYSESFRADRASILLQELGLLTASLREHLLKYRKFFDAKDRLQKIKSLVAPDDTAPDLDRKMMAVIAKADQPEMFNLVRTIFHAWVEVGSGRQAAGSEAVADSANSHLPTANCQLPSADCDLDNPPAVFSQIEKFDLDLPFWQMAKATFGYEEENPSLKNFLLRLVLTDFAHHLKGDVPQAIRGLLLPKTGWSNAVVCLAQWRDKYDKRGNPQRVWRRYPGQHKAQVAASPRMSASTFPSASKAVGPVTPSTCGRWPEYSPLRGSCPFVRSTQLTGALFARAQCERRQKRGTRTWSIDITCSMMTVNPAPHPITH